MTKQVYFQLLLPVEIEPVLEGLLGPRVMAQPRNDRNHAAGEYLVKLIQEEAARQEASRPKRAPVRQTAAEVAENERWRKASKKAFPKIEPRGRLPVKRQKPPEPEDD